MKQPLLSSVICGSAVASLLALAACGDDAGQATTDSARAVDSAGGDSGSGSGCALAADTTDTANVSASGCAVRARDTSACEATRMAAGLSGFWLKMSCRVDLSVTSGLVTADSDDEPDYVSNYFAPSDPCHETYTGAIQNPNTLSAQSLRVRFPLAPSGGSQPMQGAIVGMALDGVGIFANFAAPGDDIYQEAMTFDRCGGHPQNTGVYHFHGEPYAISDDDELFIGVMRDGLPIYGRRDPDGTVPTDLDAAGGHTGVTVDSATPTYHYHVNLQTSTAPGTAGEQQWFLTTGTYHAAPAACSDCN